MCMYGVTGFSEAAVGDRDAMIMQLQQGILTREAEIDRQKVQVAGRDEWCGRVGWVVEVVR